MFVDTHCHILKEYYENFDEVFANMQKNKVELIINNGTDKVNNLEVLDSIKKYNWMYGAIGIHPESVHEYTKEDLLFIEEHLKDDKIVAIGEIGLDYHYETDFKEEQIYLFEQQLKLAEKYNKPVIVHSRDATKDTIEILKKYKVRGVIHGFSGSLEVANIYIKMGFLLGINGVITFKNCHLKEVVEKISLSNIVLETDSPYLTPMPYRGKRNEPSYLIYIANFIANIKKVDELKMLSTIRENVKRVFDI